VLSIDHRFWLSCHDSPRIVTLLAFKDGAQLAKCSQIDRSISLIAEIFWFLISRLVQHDLWSLDRGCITNQDGCFARARKKRLIFRSFRPYLSEYIRRTSIDLSLNDEILNTEALPRKRAAVQIEVMIAAPGARVEKFINNTVELASWRKD